MTKRTLMIIGGILLSGILLYGLIVVGLIVFAGPESQPPFVVSLF